jgi:hypothetical protein
MSENSNAAGAALRAETPRGCERAEEFITYLYGEATPDESRLFRRHLEACAVCREELAALGVVRETVGVWRAEALGSVPSLDIGDAPAAETRREPSRRRSASAALREFFSLAPLWLRAGAFAATLALCALTALTLARAEVSWDANGLAFRAGTRAEVVKEQSATPARDVYTAEQLEAVVARRVAEVTAQLGERQRPQPPRPESIVNVAGVGDKSRTQSAVAAAGVQRRNRVRRPDSRRDDSPLADDNLPRLSDLLDGSY